MKIKVSVEKANSALKELSKKGKVSFNGESGSFNVRGVEGKFSYNNEDLVLTVVITDTPFLVSEDYCYSEIKKYFS